MHNLADYEERFRHHEEKTAAVDREGWMRPQRGRRSVRAALTKALLARATRIAPRHRACPGSGTHQRDGAGSI